MASLLLVPLLASTVFAPSASAAQTVQLGAAAPFAVLAGTAVTDVPTSSITGDVGLSPASGTNYAGLTQAQVTGTIYSTDGTGPAGNVNDPALLTTAQNDLTTAYVAAAGQPPTTTFVTTDNQLGGQTLTPGVYAFGHAATANITASSPLVLNGQGNTNAVFVFQASSDLVTASNSVVQLENGAQACNVFWQVGSSATLNSGSTFVGTIMALTSATLDSGATVQGRVLARNGAVTLDANTITTPSTCAASSSTTTTTSTPITPTASTGTGSGSTAGGTQGIAGTAGSAVATGSPTTGAAANRTNSAGSAGVGSGVASVPQGFPQTGFGGAAHARDGNLIAFGGLVIAGSIGAFIVALRRRPGLRRRGTPSTAS
ncbi:MAG: ice-binding family protein [Acidimicrobiales bacterium]